MVFKHLLRLVALVIAVHALAATTMAPASTITISPGGATTGTAGASQLVLNTARTTIACTTTGYVGTYRRGVFPGVSPPVPISDSTFIQPTFALCRGIGGIGVGVLCTRRTVLNATGLTAGTDGVTPISLTSIACTATVLGTQCSVNIGGAVVGDHNNARSQVTVSTTGQTLAATGSTNGTGTGACLALPNDSSVTLSAGSALVYTESPTQSIVMA